MMKRVSVAAIFLVVLALCGAAFAEEAAPPAEKYGSAVGDKLKPFKLNEPVLNKTFELKDLADGKKDAALIFMQTACTLCVNEVTEFAGAKDEIEEKLGVALVSVDFDAKRIPPYKEAYKVPFPILHDGDASVLESAGFKSTPAIVLVDSKGIIKKRIEGYDKLELKNILKSYK